MTLPQGFQLAPDFQGGYLLWVPGTSYTAARAYHIDENTIQQRGWTPNLGNSGSIRSGVSGIDESGFNLDQIINSYNANLEGQARQLAMNQIAAAHPNDTNFTDAERAILGGGAGTGFRAITGQTPATPDNRGLGGFTGTTDPNGTGVAVNPVLTPATGGSTGGTPTSGVPQMFLAADGKTVVTADGQPVSLDDYKRATGQNNVPDASLDWSHVTKSPPPAGGGTSQGTSTSTLPSTGNPQMDALQEELKKIADQMAANGKIINPNIQLTPADVQKFLDEATAQVSPYYKSQIDALKGDLTTNLKYLTDQYNLKTQSDQASFQKNLGDTRENLAGNGLAFSGVRGGQEQAIQADQQNSLDSAANTAAKNAADAVSQTAQKTGSSNLLDLSPPSLSGYTADLSGKGTYNPTRTLSYMNPTTTTGSLQYSQAGDTRSLQDFLQQQEINKRTLSFSG